MTERFLNDFCIIYLVRAGGADGHRRSFCPVQVLFFSSPVGLSAFFKKLKAASLSGPAFRTCPREERFTQPVRSPQNIFKAFMVLMQLPLPPERAELAIIEVAIHPARLPNHRFCLVPSA